MVNWLTAFIAFIVALISALQWITARQKGSTWISFDKRFAVYEELREAFSGRGGEPPTMEDIAKFTLAANRAQFLFGPEVTSFLEGRELDLDSLFVPDHSQTVQEEYLAHRNHVIRFFRDFDALVAPYMKHTQKRFPIPYIDA